MSAARRQGDDTPLQVLLFSPVAGLDPDSGDTAYTAGLLSNPPPGVTYTTYQEAIADGSVVVRGRRLRHGRWSLVDLLVLMLRGVESVLRGRLLFREPLWFITIAPGFDLVHNHTFGLVQLGTARTPVISSAGYPLRVLYSERERWSPRRVRLAEHLQRGLARALHAHVAGCWAPGEDLMTVYSETFRSELAPQVPGPVNLLGQGVPAPLEPLPGPPAPAATFIGRDFYLKGGDLAVAAWEIMRKSRPGLKLVVVTTEGPHLSPLRETEGVTVMTRADHREVLETVLPSTSVLLHPTRADCGAPFAVLEALSCGIPVVTSTVPWLDDRLAGAGVRRVVRDPVAVAAAAGELLDGALSSRHAARALVTDYFSMPVFGMSVRQSYDEALARRDLRGSP